MHWGQIKTLFILCFLLLDIYLLYLVIVKQEEANIDPLNRPEISIEQQLKSENIVIEADLPENPPDESFISISQKRFSEEDLKQLDDLKNQEIKVAENKFIISKFEEPVALPDDVSKDVITSIVQNNIIYPSEYVYDNWNKDLNIITFFQVKNDHTVYYNQNGMVMVYLNDDNELIGYTQSVLGEPSIRDENTIIKPIRAIWTLYDKMQLSWGETVTDIEMGYYMMHPLDNGVHILVPTWKVTVDENKNRYVNAVERLVFPVNDDDLLIESIQSNIEKIRLLEDDLEFKTEILQFLNSKMEVVKSE